MNSSQENRTCYQRYSYLKSLINYFNATNLIFMLYIWNWNILKDLLKSSKETERALRDQLME